MTEATTGNITEGILGNTTESDFAHTGGSGFSPPPQERVPVNAQYTDYTEYRVPANVPVLQDLSLPLIHQTPQATEMTSAFENTASQTGGLIFFSSITQQPPAGHTVSLPIPHNVTAQHAPEQLVQIPHIGQNISLPVNQQSQQQIPSFLVQQQAPQIQQAAQFVQSPQQSMAQNSQQMA